MMAKDIEPKLKTISDYFKIDKTYIFKIPEYQRAYSWTITQCDKLWQDVENYIESGLKDPYFFGTVIMDCSSEGIFNLIDGQQRTTTFLLLLKAMQLRLNKTLQDFKADEDTKKLENALTRKRDRIVQLLYKCDDDLLEQILDNWNYVKGIQILENHSINEQYKTDLQTILEAKTYEEAESNVVRIPRKQKDNKYTNFFRNFKFFYTKLGEYKESKLNSFTDTFISKCQIIEIRSWQIEQAITMFNSLNSTGMPLSDADIISAQLYANANDKTLFNEQWEKLIKGASELETRKIINIDSVLQEYMYILRACSKEYMAKGYTDVTTPGIRNYYTIIHKEILDKPFDLCNAFNKIVTIWDTIKDYPIVKLLFKFNENVKIFLISYLFKFDERKITEDTVLEISECLLKLFTILELVDTGYSSSYFKTFLFEENVKFVDPRFTIEEIKDDFSKHIKKHWSENDLRIAVMDYDKGILVFLNEYLYAKSKIIDFNFTESVNIEHIMPASGHNINIIREDAGILSQEEFDSIVNKLGNKILLEENINKSIGKEWF
ncbi:MAG: DUF262 domain-containing protein, partial [Bacilli bacterium]|nr:DUF262 domain-containing protein [Bacilli bacterium]